MEAVEQGSFQVYMTDMLRRSGEIPNYKDY